MIETLSAWLGVEHRAEFWWVVIGLAGQFAFASRFIVQWLASERAGRSVVPHIFWYLSIVGGLVLLSYALYRQDPVFVLGQSMGVFIYSRNLWLIHAEKKRELSP